MTVQTHELDYKDGFLSLRVTPDGKFAVILHKIGFSFEHGWSELRLYDLITSSFLSDSVRAYRGYKLTTPLDISPNRRYIAIVYGIPGTIQDITGWCIWDTQTSAFLPSIEDDSYDFVRYKSYQMDSIDMQSGSDWIYIQFLDDNDRVVTANDSGEIYVWSLSQQRLLWFVGAASHSGDCIALSHKFGLFAMTEFNHKYGAGQIGRHGAFNDQIVYRKYGMSEGRTVMASEPIRTGCCLRLWNIYSGTLIHELHFGSWVGDLVFSHNDSLLAGSVGGENKLRSRITENRPTYIWDVNTGKRVQILPENTKPIGFTKNDKVLVVQEGENQIRLWNLSNHTWLDTGYEFDGRLASVQMTDTDKVVAALKFNDNWQLIQIELQEI